MAIDRLGPVTRQRQLANLNFKALAIFVSVVDEGSMALAAARLNMSASGVSQQISNLEQALGVKLFDRGARPIALTPAGTLLRHHSDRILDVVARAQTELLELSLTSLPQFQLGIIDDLDASITPDLVGLFQSAHPRCLISAQTGRSDHLTQTFLRRELDVVVSGQVPEDTTNLDVFRILQEPFILVTAKGSLKRNRDTMEQLLDMPFVGFNDMMPLGRLVKQQFRRVGINAEKRVSFDATRAVHSMVAKFHGWTVSTPLCALDTPRCLPDLDLAPLPFPGFSRRIYLINRSGELGSLPQRLAQQCRELIGAYVLPQVNEIAPWASEMFRIGDVPEFDMAETAPSTAASAAGE